MIAIDPGAFLFGCASSLALWCVVLYVAYCRDCRRMKRLRALKPLYRPAWHALQTGSLTQGIKSLRHAKDVIKELERAYPDIRATRR